jgi:NADPH-dependent ferric siderophore reductase
MQPFEHPPEAARHTIQRVRHEVRRRLLTVTEVTALTPKMLRVTFTSPELTDFTSLGPDDHIKIFLTDAVGQPVMRDYTPRSFDREAQTLTIDFALHDAGPATAWAMGAKVGDTLQIGGPRGSMIVPDDFDWWLLIADETGLPALGRRLEGLRPGVAVTTIAVIDDEAEIQQIATAADWTAHWLRREAQTLDDAALLRAAVATLPVPQGDGYVWIAAEAHAARAGRAFFLEERNHPPTWMRAAGYWLRGEAGADQSLD